MADYLFYLNNVDYEKQINVRFNSYDGPLFTIQPRGSQHFFIDSFPVVFYISIDGVPNDKYLGGRRPIFSGNYNYSVLQRNDGNYILRINSIFLDSPGPSGNWWWNMGESFKPVRYASLKCYLLLMPFAEYVREELRLSPSDISFPGYIVNEYHNEIYFRQTTPLWTNNVYNFPEPIYNVSNKFYKGIVFSNGYFDYDIYGYILTGNFNNPPIIPISSLLDLQEVGNLDIRTFAAGTEHAVLAFASKHAYYKQVNHIIGGPQNPIWPPNSIFMRDKPSTGGGGVS